MANFTADILAADNDIIFADWAQDATYVQVESETDLETGDVTEELTETSITVIPGDVTPYMIANSGGRYQAGDRIFGAKTADLPEDPPKDTSRFVYSGDTYTIIEFTGSSDNLRRGIVARRTTDT